MPLEGNIRSRWLTWRRCAAAATLATAAICLAGGAASGAPSREAALRPAHADPAPRASAHRLGEKRSPAPPSTAGASEAAFNGCTKVPAGRRVVTVSLAPDTDVDHLIAWLSSVTCRTFVYAVEATAHNRNVTIVAPKTVTPAEAFRLVLNALDSVGLTLQPVDNFFQVIESQRARTGSIPVYDYDGHRISDEPPPGPKRSGLP